MRAIAGAVLAVAVAFPAAANAQNCPQPESTLDTQVFPRSSTGIAPTDTLVWYLTDDRLATHEGIERALSLISLGGEGEIELERAGVARAGNRGLFAFRPVDPLSPETDHEIEYLVQPLGNAVAVTTFRTGSGPAGDAPPVPRVTGRVLASDYSLFGDWCSSQDYRDEALFTLDSVAMFDLATREGGDWTFAEDPFADPLAAVGSGELSIQDDVAPLTTLTVRFGSFDLAGQFSGWSEEVEESMPASGCRDNGEDRIVFAALPFALLLMLGLGPRRRRYDLLLLLGVATFAIAPTVALAGGPALIEEATPEVDAPKAEKVSWRAIVDERTRLDSGVLGGIGIAAGVVDGVTLAALAPRGHGALQIRLVNTIVWAPTTGALIVVGGVRHALKDRISARHLSRGLRGSAIALTSVTIPLTVMFSIASVTTGQYDVSLGISMMAIPASMWGTAITLMAYDQIVRDARTKWKKPYTALRPEPRLVVAGPTGFLFVF
jgi:hypothetical protein